MPDLTPVRRAARRQVQLVERLRAKAIGQIRYRGSRVECPCCGARYCAFAPYNGPDRMCWSCGALERDRLLSLFLAHRPGLLHAGMQILHIAPERALRPRFEQVAANYVAGDLWAEFGEHSIDVTRLAFADESFDAVICNHVLEHVPDDRGAMRELRRVLRRGGWAILLVPDLAAAITVEDPTVQDPAERERLFGQRDHVRRYGWDYFTRLSDVGFTPEAISMESELTPAEIQRHRLRKFGELEPICFCR